MIRNIFLLLLPLVSAPGLFPGTQGPDFVIDRGEGHPELRVPEEEKLVFSVRMQLALVEANVGRVTMRSMAEDYRASVLGGPAPTGGVAGPSAPEATEQQRTASFRIQAKGEYAWYSMDAIIETRILPQEWPRISYRYTQVGSERRRREVHMGHKDGEWQASYRKDTRKGAPKGTRIWRDPKTRVVPAETLDLLGAVYLVRTMIQDDIDKLYFPVIDKLKLWEMRLSRGETRRVDTAAGSFDAIEIFLDPRPLEGEKVDEEKAKRFEGLFGLHGSIHLWVEKRTGVPIRIQGELPVGPLDLGIDIELQSFEGTPAAFLPLPRRED